jgi:ketosteroid isomerase-like protein
MKRLIPVVIFLTTLLSAAAPKAEKEVLAAMDAWKQGMLKRDASTLDRIFHPDLTYSHSNGRTETKAEAIENATKGPAVTESIDVQDQTVRVYGNTALVKAKIAIKMVNAGNTNNLLLSVLHVWLKTPKGWQLVGRQSTRLNP